MAQVDCGSHSVNKKNYIRIKNNKQHAQSAQHTMPPSVIVLKIRPESFLVEKIFHLEDLLKFAEYPEYSWIPQFFIGNYRPKFLNIIEKLKELGWEITHQVMNEKVWLVTMETDQFRG